jgi:hypothetical protein
MTGTDRPSVEAEFAFFCRQVSVLAEPSRRFALAADDFVLFNPNTRTCPTFRTRRDAELTRAIYLRVPVLLREGRSDGNPWGVSFAQGLFNMASDSGLFRTREELKSEGFVLIGNILAQDGETWLPLYEAKMVHHFDHRFGTYEGQTEAQANQGKLPELTPEEHDDQELLAMPRYWVPRSKVTAALGDSTSLWLLGWRGITGATVERTMIASALPVVGAGHSLFLATSSRELWPLQANLSSFVFDYVMRQKIGGLNASFYIVQQLAALHPDSYHETCAWSADESRAKWMQPRTLELVYTAVDIEGFGRQLGYKGSPFGWDPARRALLRAELDAAFFHFYGLAEEDVDYVMDTFPIVKRRDEEKFGHYRTKALILDVYRKMADAIAAGTPYETTLDPPPADPRVAHGALSPEVVVDV